MKTTIATLLLAAVAHCVHGHGQMTKPAPRKITDRYRKDCYAGLAGAGEEELQYAPVELLSKRTQADRPSPPSFDMMNGCRGMIYEEGGPLTELSYGTEFPVEWFIQAPHPGYMELSVVKAKKDGEKIMYEKVASLKKIDKFAEQGGNGQTTASIPSSVTGCDKPGDCALQFYWHSDLADQTYPTCADIVIKGGGGGGGDNTQSPTPAPGPGPVVPTVSPNTPTSSPGPNPNPTPAPGPNPAPTNGPSPAPGPAPSPSKKDDCKFNRQNDGPSHVKGAPVDWTDHKFRAAFDDFFSQYQKRRMLRSA